MIEQTTALLIEKGILGIALAVSLSFNFVQWRYIVKLVEQLRKVAVDSTATMQELTHAIKEHRL